MFENHRCIAIIPARGKSEGIPRKNVCLMAGKPLICHVIETARKATCLDRIVVTTDDDEIAFLAENCGASVLRREAHLALADVPLDPVVHDAVTRAEHDFCESYDLVFTIQPTSPLLKPLTIDVMARRMVDGGHDTLIAVVEDSHLRWGRDERTGGFRPLYPDRVNRQYLPPQFRETGAVLITRREFVTPESRLGPKLSLFPMDAQEAVDIDHPMDWMLAERMLQRLRIAFVVAGSRETGTGHAYRVMSLAQGLVGHDLRFLCMPGSELAADLLRASRYRPVQLAASNVPGQVLSCQPDIIVNDILDTEEEFVGALQETGAFVCNLEDEGPGADVADLVINALYRSRLAAPHVHSGEPYFCLRNEFRASRPHEIRDEVKNVLLSFGGTDPADLTRRCLDAIDDVCAQRGIGIAIITGFGYAHAQALADRVATARAAVTLLPTVTVISQHMRAADICLTSYGRTLFELASLGTPTIAMAQNERELTHTFVHPENGVVALGLGTEVTPHKLLEAFTQMCDSRLFRETASHAMRRTNLANGVENVIDLLMQSFRARDGRKAT